MWSSGLAGASATHRLEDTMATRTTSPARSARSARSGKRPTAGTGGRSGRAPQQPRAPWPVRMLRGLWLGIAHLIGGTLRRMGSDARGLDRSEERRVGKESEWDRSATG